MTGSVYGRIVTEGQVRQAVQNTIRRWEETYRAEVSRQTGLALPPLRSYGTGIDADTPASQFPACVIVAPGIVGEPDRRGDGTHDVTWGIGVGVVVADKHRDTACDLAGAYGAAMRALLLQNQDLGGFAAGLDWVDEEVTQVEWTSALSIHAAALEFRATIRNVADASAGLLVPPSPDATVPVSTIAVSSTSIAVTTGRS